jgi:hypothetical protein
VFGNGYQGIVDRFVSDVAAASGSTSNVFSIATEYYQDVGGAKTPISYKIRAGTPVVATDAFPSNGCTPAHGYAACLTDDQLRTELQKVLASHGLPSDLAHFYPVLFPPAVETKDRDGTTSVQGFCGYHRAFGSGANQTVYANLPYEAGCDGGQAPNGNAVADGVVSTLSHELTEAITDPLTQVAWNDNAGNEIADMCGFTYGRPLGSTDPSNPGQTEYNQVINGDKYYLQREFSDLAYSKYGVDNGCVQSEALAGSQNGGGGGSGQGSSGSTSGAQSKGKTAGVITVVNDITPTALPADGTSTAEVSLGVFTAASYAVPDDPVHFTLGVQSGTGQCGTLSTSDKNTNDNGFADITYTASRSNVSCWVIAVEGQGGQAAESVLYQGTMQKQSPTYTASFPTTLHAGGSTTFTIKATNPTPKPIPSVRPDFAITPTDGATKNVNASQLHLSYSTTGPNGTFTPVHLTGATITEGGIDGPIGPPQGMTLPPDSTTTYTYDIALASTVPVVKRKPQIGFESYLDQVNPADGTAATLADTYEFDVLVPSEASTRTSLNIWAAVAAALALAIGSLLIWRTARRPQGPTGQPLAT